MTNHAAAGKGAGALTGGCGLSTAESAPAGLLGANVYGAESAEPGGIQPCPTCVVTVTYGDRRHLLRPVLATLLRDPAIGKIVLVKNGAEWDVQALATELAPDGRIEVVELATNQGSAAGFAAGIQRACSLGAEFIWLLDDDNQPEPNALPRLFAAYEHLRTNFSEDGLAVAAFRHGHQTEVAAGVPLWPLGRRRSSFRGLHLFDLPYKLWRRGRYGPSRAIGSLPQLVEMAVAPYGGLLFHQAVVKRHGLPRADFVLYGDDTEFTYRITRGGGAIRLVTSAEVVDLEESWSLKSRFRNTFRACLKSSSDLRAYYSTRNQAYIDSHYFPDNGVAFWINRQIYCFALWLYAIALRRLDRYRLLRDAIRDGLAGRLSMHPRHPLFRRESEVRNERFTNDR